MGKKLNAVATGVSVTAKIVVSAFWILVGIVAVTAGAWWVILIVLAYLAYLWLFSGRILIY